MKGPVLDNVPEQHSTHEELNLDARGELGAATAQQICPAAESRVVGRGMLKNL